MHRDRTDPGLDHPLWPGTMAQDVLTPVRQTLFAELGDEARSLRLQRRHQDPARAPSRAIPVNGSTMGPG